MQLHISKKACVSVYPSLEQQGILWFWPDLSQGPINMEAAAKPPPLFPEFSDSSFGYDVSSRDLEYGFGSETMIAKYLITYSSPLSKVYSSKLLVLLYH